MGPHSVLHPLRVIPTATHRDCDPPATAVNPTHAANASLLFPTKTGLVQANCSSNLAPPSLPMWPQSPPMWPQWPQWPQRPPMWLQWQQKQESLGKAERAQAVLCGPSMPSSAIAPTQLPRSSAAHVP